MGIRNKKAGKRSNDGVAEWLQLTIDIFNKRDTNYMQKSDYIVIRCDAEMKRYFEVLGNKYHIKRSEFIRQAIIEKLKRDVPKIREINKKSDCPF